MKQLTGLDVSFLLMESPNTYGHVNGLSIYDRPSSDFDPFTIVRERMRIMAGHLEPLRRKLVEVPFDLDRPYWIEDADFDIDFHVRHLGLAPPGAADQLAEQVARIVGRKMDRTRPLWEAYVIEGLADGRWALLQKTHHATIDGASGVIMLKMFTDDSRDAEWDLQELPWVGEQPPSRGELLQRSIRHIAGDPVRGMRLGLGVLRDMADAAGVTSVSGLASQARTTLGSIGKSLNPASRPDDSHASGSSVSLPITPAPATPWTKTVTPHRRFAMRSTALGTLNDVVMAVCTGALREYLIQHDALPDAPLRAMVPVSIRTGKEEDPWTNRVSAIIAELPTNCADPIERVALCREAMVAAKHQFDLVPAEAISEAADYTSPVVAASALRLFARAKMADRFNSPINVVISNVPGPRDPLYFAGAKLDSYIPVSTIADGVGLNITVHSYEDSLDFGLIADRDLVPDLWNLVDLHIAEIERLFEATGAEWAVPQPPPPMRKGGDGVDPIAPSSDEVREHIEARREVEFIAPKKTAAKKAASKKRTAKKTAAKKAAPRKRTAKKTAAKKAAPKKRTAKKRTAKQAAAQR